MHSKATLLTILSILNLSLLGCDGDSGIDGQSAAGSSSGGKTSGSGGQSSGDAGSDPTGEAGSGPTGEGGTNPTGEGGEGGSNPGGEGGNPSGEGGSDGGPTTPDGEYLQYSGTMDGNEVEATCTPGDDIFAAEYLGVTLAGVQVNVFCPGTPGTFVTIGGFGFSLDNIENLDGAFSDDDPTEFQFRIVNETTNKAAFASSENVIMTEVVGNYDTATRALTGSFSGEWGPPEGEYDIEGTISGTFSVIVPE